MKIVVIAKCVSCGKKVEIGKDDVPKGECPMCPDCFLPLVAIKAKDQR